MQKFGYLFLAIMFLGGCSQNEQGQGQATHPKQGHQVTEVKNTNIQEPTRETGQEIAARLSDLAIKVPQVRDATAVVLGTYAIVGIDVDQDIDRSQVGTIKYSVGEALQNDPYGATAVIVADPDLNARIREAATNIKKGKPVRGILNELSDITSRIIPEVPGDYLKQTPSKTMDKQNKSIDNDQEQQQLEKEQNKQSNGHKDKLTN